MRIIYSKRKIGHDDWILIILNIEFIKKLLNLLKKINNYFQIKYIHNLGYSSSILPQSTISTLVLGFPDPEPYYSMALTTLIPSTTFPKTVCLPSSHGHGTVVIKNWDPFVLGPAFAIDNYPIKN